MGQLLDFLVPSRARRAVLTTLLGRRQGLSVRELARAARVPFSGAQRELAGLRKLGLLQVEPRGTGYACRWNASAPGAALLGKLLSGPSDPPLGVLLRNLKRWGAPLVDAGRRGPALDLEETLVAALGPARRRPELAVVWPLLLARHRNVVDLQRLAGLARRCGRKRELGFLGAVAARLLQDSTLARWAETLHDRRVRKTESFFDEAEGSRLARLSALRTPAAARRFGFRVNLPMSAFQSAFRKFGDRS